MDQSTLIPQDAPQKEPLPPALDKLKAERVEQKLRETPDWHLASGGTAIERQFEFEKPYQALAFAGLVYGLTARWRHRPEVRIARTNTVTCVLTTAAAGGLSDLDFQIARRLSAQV